jgi:hypothetical protein
MDVRKMGYDNDECMQLSGMLPVFLVSKQISAGTPSLYTGSSSNNFFLFPKVKEIRVLEGGHFDDNDDISSNTTAALKAIPQNEFQNCFEGWTRR